MESTWPKQEGLIRTTVVQSRTLWALWRVNLALSEGSTASWSAPLGRGLMISTPWSATWQDREWDTPGPSWEEEGSPGQRRPRLDCFSDFISEEILVSLRRAWTSSSPAWSTGSDRTWGSCSRPKEEQCPFTWEKVGAAETGRPPLQLAGEVFP